MSLLIPPEPDALRDYLRAVLVAKLSPAAEAEMWAMEMGEPRAPLAFWAVLWATRRPLEVKAGAEGYPLTGRAVLSGLADITSSEGPPDSMAVDVHDGRNGPQARLRVEWAEFAEPVVFLRAPRMEAADRHSWQGPDCWRQLDASEDDARAPRNVDEDAFVRGLLPGVWDDGVPRPPVDPMMRALWDRLGEPIGVTPCPAPTSMPASSALSPAIAGADSGAPLTAPVSASPPRLTPHGATPLPDTPDAGYSLDGCPHGLDPVDCADCSDPATPERAIASGAASTLCKACKRSVVGPVAEMEREAARGCPDCGAAPPSVVVSDYPDDALFGAVHRLRTGDQLGRPTCAECSSLAALRVGAGKGATLLCEPCANSPKHRRKTKREPLFGGDHA